MEAGQDGCLVVFCWWVGVSIMKEGQSGGLLVFHWWVGASNMENGQRWRPSALLLVGWGFKYCREQDGGLLVYCWWVGVFYPELGSSMVGSGSSKGRGSSMMGQYGTGVRRTSPSGATILLLPVSLRQDGGARVTLRHEDVAASSEHKQAPEVPCK